MSSHVWLLAGFGHPVQEVVKTLEAKRRARAEEYYKRKKYLQVRRERVWLTVEPRLTDPLNSSSHNRQF